jgi:hypothetical protein
MGITGYVLAMGISIPISGWAGNRFGGKWIFMFASTNAKIKREITPIIDVGMLVEFKKKQCLS